MRTLTIITAILLIGCANTSQNQTQRWQDSKYNRCVDQIHARQKDGERVSWALEIDACMGRKGDEYQAYQAAKQDKMPTRAEFEAQ